MNGSPFTERSLIEGIARRFPLAGGGVVKGIGDDCAVLRQAGGRLLLATTDTLVEGVHFDLAWHPPELLGRKSLAVNVSDIAAMGGTPRWALLSLGLPAGCGWVEAFLDGFRAEAADCGVALAGGDTVRAPGAAVITITLLGEVNEEQVLYRSGARPGDSIWVSGTMGDAAAGLALCQAGYGSAPEWAETVAAHLAPRPETALGRLLAESGLVHALIDTSDGVATDLGHLCAASGCGAELTAEDLPVSPAVQQAAARLGADAVTWTLSGGEDYRLLFTSAEEDAEPLRRLVRERLEREIHAVGRIVAGEGVWLCGGGGRREIGFQGFDHFPGKAG